MKRIVWGSAVLALGVACSAGTSEPPGGVQPGTSPDAGKADAATVDGAPNVDDPGADASVDANVDAGVTSGPPPSSLPVSFTRPDVGQALTPAELAQATDELIAILKDTRYFDFVDERVHGWPESDPKKGYWWGTFWTGISAKKSAGKVTYKHSNDGSDNAGIHTSPYLEGACYAHLMWGQAKTGQLVRRMSRGMTAWILAMERNPGDTPLLARAFYPPSVESNDGGRSLFIDYSLSRPGIDAEPSDYVYNPNNPTFKDIYVKNKRSKDDIGHMLRAIVQTQTCAPRLDAAGKADVEQTMNLYKGWANAVDANGLAIATIDKSLNIWTPPIYPYMLAHYIPSVECVSGMAVRYMAGNPIGNLSCGNGFGAAEKLGYNALKNDARQIMRTHHAAAVTLAFLRNENQMGLELLKGLTERVETDMGLVDNPPQNFSVIDVTSLLIYANNVGVPLTSKEVRWLHSRLHDAYVGMRDPAFKGLFNLFDASTPDGDYSFDPPNIGMFYKDLAMMVGSCASPNRNPTARPMLDCARLQAAF